MDELLTPIERNVHSYLTGSVAKDLIEVLAQLSLVRPADPYLYLAQQFLARSPQAAELQISRVIVGNAASEAVSRDELGTVRSTSRGRSRERPGSGRHRGSAAGVGADSTSVGARPLSGGAYTDAPSRPSTAGY